MIKGAFSTFLFYRSKAIPFSIFDLINIFSNLILPSLKFFLINSKCVNLADLVKRVFSLWSERVRAKLNLQYGSILFEIIKIPNF